MVESVTVHNTPENMSSTIQDILPPLQPPVVTETKTVVSGGLPPSWMSRNLRNMIAISMTGMVCYLAIVGNHDAQIALVASFSVLMGAIWGERAALKNPGRDS